MDYDPSPVPASGLPFLFDTSQFKDQEFRVRMCGEAAAGASRYKGKGTCFGCAPGAGWDGRLASARVPPARPPARRPAAPAARRQPACDALRACRPCIFQTRLCDQVHRRSNRSAEVAAAYMAAGWRFGDLSPCELFQRIRCARRGRQLPLC